jgi:hypothetical protein
MSTHPIAEPGDERRLLRCWPRLGYADLAEVVEEELGATKAAALGSARSPPTAASRQVATKCADVLVTEHLGRNAIEYRQAHHVDDALDVSLAGARLVPESVEVVRKPVEVSTSGHSAQARDAALVLEALL